MPIISQTNLDTLMRVVNDGKEDVMQTVTNESRKFAEDLSQIWESPKAQKFAADVQEALTTVTNSYDSALTGVHETVSTAVKNHNAFNNAAVALAPMSGLGATIVVGSLIKDHFSDGSASDAMGIKQGHQASEVMELFNKMVAETSEKMQASAQKVARSGAFDEDETMAVANRFKKQHDAFQKTTEELRDQLKEALNIVDEDAAKLHAANVVE